MGCAHVRLASLALGSGFGAGDWARGRCPAAGSCLLSFLESVAGITIVFACSVSSFWQVVSRIFSSCGRDARSGDSPLLACPEVGHPTPHTVLSQSSASSPLQERALHQSSGNWGVVFRHPRVIGQLKVRFASYAPSCHSRMLFNILTAQNCLYRAN